jgi:transcriptional regulator of acetoin/glycerol metabolism
MTQKASHIPAPFPLTPLSQAVIESVSDGIVIFDSDGRVLYANQRGRHAIDEVGEPAFQRRGALRERLAALGGQVRPLKQGSTELGEAVFLPNGDYPTTLAERERRAIIETLELTHGKLAETARRLGISRTTLWRRLRAYGLRPDAHGGLGSPHL